MRKKALVAVLLIVPAMIWAQQKLVFHSSVAGGLIVGQQNPSGLVETINGVRFGQWTTGVGVGIDWYGLRSVPVFASVQRSFLTKKQQTFFAYANGGYNRLWPSQNQKGRRMDRAVIDSRGGLYCDIGFGHQMPVFKSQKLSVSVGYTVKQYEEKTQPSYWFATFGEVRQGDYEPTTYHYKYSLGRLNLKIGLRL